MIEPLPHTPSRDPNILRVQLVEALARLPDEEAARLHTLIDGVVHHLVAAAVAGDTDQVRRIAEAIHAAADMVPNVPISPMEAARYRLATLPRVAEVVARLALPVTTELPTEEGLYLFAGVRDVGRLDVRDLNNVRVELVRVGRDASKKLVYVGSDFFWTPQSTLGAWLRVQHGAAEVRGTAHRMLVAHLALHNVVEAVKKGWGWASQAHLIRSLAGPFSDGVKPAEEVVAWAIEHGIIERDEQGACRLAGSKGE